MDKQQHNKAIKEQFSKQAAAYTSVKAHSDALDLLIEMSGVSEKDHVIDLACGSGIVSCEFAKYAGHVTGIDITESMLKLARKLQLKNKLTNIDWVLDDVLPLKFKDNQFSIVISRFGFHHFIDYDKVFDEMIRVCKSGGTVMVVDVALPEDKLEAYDTMEKLRDSSHVGALSLNKFDELFQTNKLVNYRKTSYKMAIELENQLSASFPDPAARGKLKSMIVGDAGINNLGVNVTLADEKYQLYYPVQVCVGQKK
ncbi:MAG: class I SAM-dependent methyltransferase [Mangrovibacterium sp.]